MTAKPVMKSAAASTNSKTPNFFIVGAPKSGTTAMYRYLRAHPQIFMPEKKEIHYFCSDLEMPQSIRDEDAYHALYDPARGKSHLGDASASYLFSRVASANIKAYCPEAQIIIMLRDPVEMVYALHSQRVYTSVEDILDFEAALEAEEGRKAGRLPGRTGLYRYREVARYRPQVQRYLDRFPADQVQIILFDEFKADTTGIYRQTLERLDVAPDFRPTFTVVNPNKLVRSHLLNRINQRRPEWLRALTGALVPLPLRRLDVETLLRANSRVERRPPLDPALRARLREEFAADISRLSQLIQRDLSSWMPGGRKA